MRSLTTGEKARNKAEAVTTLGETCDRLVYARSADSVTDGVGAWDTETSGIACGFEYKSAGVNNGQPVAVEGAGVLRLALTQTLDISDKIRVHDAIWTIEGIDPGQTLQRVFLKRDEVALE